VEAVEFLRTLNAVVHAEVPGVLTVAEESTAWPGVSKAVSAGGLGFSFKWNMGWMHDTLVYFAKDPVYRRYHQHDLTFAMIYEYSERFINPLSHDEVVHGKGSLYGKMSGDPWQKLANLRLLLTYMYTRPGKQLLFMGAELATDREWNHDRSLDWHLAADPMRAKFSTFLEELGRLYRATPPLWLNDHEPEGFAWIDASDALQSVMSYRRRAGDDEVVVVLNLTPSPRSAYRIGVPRGGRWVEVFSSDERRFGGSEYESLPGVHAETIQMHGLPHSVRLDLPPLGALVLKPA
jgi:1,4-alpha-glucan branching enzyme